MALQIPPQKDYQTLCEVYNEFTANEPLLIGNIKNVIKNDRQKYDGYSAIDHSDIGPHFHAFDKLDFGSGYKGHTGVQWHEYREENRRLRTVADKHKVTTVMLNELYPELAVPVGAYEKLVETVGVDSTLAVFHRQLEKVRSEESKTDN